MEDQNKGLAEELARVAQFATTWLRGGHPTPIDEWEFRAMPGMFSVAVDDRAPQQVPWEGAERFVYGGGAVRSLPPPDASGVVAGVWFKWPDGRRRRARPGGRYPFNTDLLAARKTGRRVSLLFTLGPPSRRRTQIWTQVNRGLDPGVESPFGPDGSIGPAFRPAHNIIEGVDHYVAHLPAPPALDRLARPGSHRARSWQRALGGRTWSGIVVSARGYPGLRVLQVALHQRWVTEDEAYRAMLAPLRRTHFWPRRPDGGEIFDLEGQAELVHVAATQLVMQAREGNHTPAYPLGKPYLQRITAKTRAALPGVSSKSSLREDEPEADLPVGARKSIARSQFHRDETTASEETAPSRGLAATSEADGPPPYQVRRVAAALAGGSDTFDSLRPDEQRSYEDRAVRSLLKRSEWDDRVRRRVALQLAMADGISSLTLLSASERQTYEDRAVETLRKRRDLRALRQHIRDRLASRGVALTPEAVQQFVALHRAGEKRGRSSTALSRPT